MRFLLVNTNPAVSKLVNASLNRIGFETKEINNYNDLPLDSFVAVIVDNDSYASSHVDDLLAVSLAPSLIYLKQQNTPTPQGFQYALTKPFLPTDFITFVVSVLKKTPDLERFITPEAKEFVSMLPEEGRVEATDETVTEIPQLTPEEQELDNKFINFNFYDDLQKKEPIFNAEEPADDVGSEPIETAFSAPKIEPDQTDDVFFDLSEDISKIYSSNENDTKEENITNQTEEVVKTPETPAVQNRDKTDASKDDNFTFDINNIKESAEDDNLDTLSWAAQNKADDKEDLNFDAIDAVEETKQQETPVAADNFLKEMTEEESTKKFNGFEDLAKEFDDLIKTPNTKENAPTKLPSYATDIKTKQHEETDQNDPFENLNEKEMRKALQEGGLLPKSAAETVKSEIQNVVQESVYGVLQSHILRDVLKGLKMNITITFEDKE